ncbi:hypothetical protein GWI33_013481 [Rhynchophorus ferrugineus]|uniref:Orn/DAP/Arg decarboxylase 2 C-terminal domain-containing protein n=1 Tax=Rhynchophorus ferrugineus TaxID=354439 RepID=A0A834I824_RHYFE|nr:hypothetical protein GWI33_013481 [Rhynchophorus ferrugineus]
MDVIGIKFHTYSGYRNANNFSQIISTYMDSFIDAGFNLKLLDIGDTILNEEDFFNIAVEVRCITDMYECFKKGTAKIIAEVGRFFVSSAYTLACKIDDIRELTNTTNIHRIYHINHDKYNFSCVYSDVPIVPKPLKTHNNKKLYASSIWGPSNNEEDQIVENVNLPKMSMGDWIIFENMGAYTSPESSGLDIIYTDNENNIYLDNPLMETEQFSDDITVPNNTSVRNMIILPFYSDNMTAGNHRLKYIHLSDAFNY